MILVPKSSLNLDFLLMEPNFSESIFGHDAFGRNLLGALSEAMARSLIFATLTTFTAVGTGIIAGASLGMMRGGRIRNLFERILDFFLAFPSILLSLAVQAIIGSGWWSLTFSVTIGIFPTVIRFVASRAKEIAVTGYVSSAYALGGSKPNVFWRHYRPELLDYIRLKLPSLIAQSLLLEATLSFLNLGVPPGTLSWGSLLAQSKDYLVEAPHIAWVTGIPLVLTLLSLQYMMDDMSHLRKRVP